MSSRRDVLETLAALAASARAADGYDLDELRDADPEREAYATFEGIGIGGAGIDVLGSFGSAALHQEDAAGARVEVSYNRREVFLSAEAHAEDDPDVRASVGLDLTTDQAREVAVALFRAAEERDADPATEEP